MNKFSRILKTLSTVILCAGSAVHAEGLRSAVILQGWQDTSGVITSALEFSMDEGWKTYWRAPGDAGFPPSFDFSGSENVARVDIIWPTPSLSGSDGYETLGYQNALVLPLRITPKSAGPVTLAVAASIGVCDDICVPVDFVMTETLSPTKKRDPKIIAALATAPFPSDQIAGAKMTCTFSQEGSKLNVAVSSGLPKTDAWERIVVEYADATAWVVMDQTKREGSKLMALATIHSGSDTPILLARDKLRLTIVTSSRSIEQIGCARR